MKRYRRIIAPLLLLVLITIGCNLFSRVDGESEVVFAVTEVGTPEGDKVTTDIGPAGGTFASPDGRLTLTVPQDALTETITFSIQPITNKAGNGLGLAYRLEPDGRTFTIPLALAIRYDGKDLEGTVPEALSIAYQDQEGAWHAQKLAKLDVAPKTLTIPTTHFSDWAIFSRLKLSPPKATLFVGENQFVELVECQEPGFIDRFFSRPQNCTSRHMATNEWSVQGAGTIAAAGNGVIYTAPAKKPTPNIAYLLYKYPFQVYDNSKIMKGTTELGTTITILDRGYRASGQTGEVVYSGVVCSFDQPFTIDSTWLGPNNPIKFVPSSGTWSFNTKYEMLTYRGGGSYTIEGADTDKPRILASGTATLTYPYGQLSKTEQWPVSTIDLSPLETNGCNEQ